MSLPPVRRGRGRPRKRSRSAESDSEATGGHAEEREYFPAAKLFEYKWPLGDATAETYMIQEQVGEYLDIRGMGRKFPGREEGGRGDARLCVMYSPFFNGIWLRFVVYNVFDALNLGLCFYMLRNCRIHNLVTPTVIGETSTTNLHTHTHTCRYGTQDSGYAREEVLIRAWSSHGNTVQYG